MSVEFVLTIDYYSFGIGCKYALGPDASIRAKVDNSSKVKANDYPLTRGAIFPYYLKDMLGSFNF